MVFCVLLTTAQYPYLSHVYCNCLSARLDCSESNCVFTQVSECSPALSSSHVVEIEDLTIDVFLVVSSILCDGLLLFPPHIHSVNFHQDIG